MKTSRLVSLCLHRGAIAGAAAKLLGQFSDAHAEPAVGHRAVAAENVNRRPCRHLRRNNYSVTVSNTPGGMMMFNGQMADTSVRRSP